jgi:hypothetical protein
MGIEKVQIELASIYLDEISPPRLPAVMNAFNDAPLIEGLITVGGPHDQPSSGSPSTCPYRLELSIQGYCTHVD